MERIQRIRTLQARLGLADEQLADALGTTVQAWHDLLAYEDRALDVMELREVVQLARILAVSPRELVCPASGAPIEDPEISLEDLADNVRGYIHRNRMTQEEFEAVVGWRLTDFLGAPQCAWRLPTMFLEDICAELGLDWRRAIPRVAHTHELHAVD